MKSESRSASVSDQMQQRCALALLRCANGTGGVPTALQRIARPRLPMMETISSSTKTGRIFQ